MHYKELDEQPVSVEIKMADDVFIKSYHVEKAETWMPQHSHAYDHTSMIARGAVRVWRDGFLMGDFIAPKGIMIEAHTKHMFMTLQDDTIIYCIHNISRSGEVEIDAEHQLSDED